MKIFRTFLQQKTVDYRAGAGAAMLTSWSRSRAYMERLHNTAHKTACSRIFINGCRNFLLAERILRSCDCSPVSSPPLPPTHQQPMWEAWDLALDMCLSQLSVDNVLKFKKYKFLEIYFVDALPSVL